MATPSSHEWGGGQGERGGDGGDQGGDARRTSETATSGGTVDDFVRLERPDPVGEQRNREGAEEPAGPRGDDPWSRADPWSEWDGAHDQHQWGDWSWSWGWQQDWWSRDTKGKDYADPPAWPGWGANYRLWKRAVKRWDQATDVAQNRRAERIFKTMDWELQARFEHISDETLQGQFYLDEILQILDVLAGERQATEMRRTVRKALFEGARRSDETISQFALRREQEFALAERYMEIPDNLKGMMLEEQAGLGKQSALNLRTLTGGSTGFRDVTQALKVLDLEEEGISMKGKANHFVGMANEEDLGDDDEQTSSSIASEDQKDILAEIERMDLDEKTAMEVFVTLEKEKRTWKENKKLKLAQKKDRRHFTDKGSRPYRPSGGRPRKPMNVDAIKKVSRCSNCGERGHWAEDCRKPYRSKAERLEQEKNNYKSGSGKPSGFVFLGKTLRDGASSSSSFAGGFSMMVFRDTLEDLGSDLLPCRGLCGDYVEQLKGVVQNDKAEIRENFNGMAIPDFAKRVLEQFKEKGSKEIFLSLPPGHAIIDPGAGQDLIGRPAYEQLRAKLAAVGLRPQPIDEEPSRASGIGGQATTLFMALIPTILGGAPGIVRVTVVQEDIPHLLSIGLLESAGSVIDTKANVIRFEEHGTQDKMLRLKSGHRTVDVTKWDGGLFPVPLQVREQYGLSEGAFNLPGAVSSH